MNEAHLQFLGSPDWARWLDSELVPWLDGVVLGDDVLEIGPGPGLTTDLLRQRAARVTAVELDDALAAALADRMAGTNVDVVHGDASNTGLAADRFSAAGCFAMLHHLPSAEVQDQVFAEMRRALRPGGVFLGTDSLDTESIRAFHLDDTFVPIAPEHLGARLDAAGFRDVAVEPTEFELRFRATKPDH
jgi:SAM-dependent methyltransferase